MSIKKTDNIHTGLEKLASAGRGVYGASNVLGYMIGKGSRMEDKAEAKASKFRAIRDIPAAMIPGTIGYRLGRVGRANEFLRASKLKKLKTKAEKKVKK